MPYAVESTVEGIRIVFSRKLVVWQTVLLGAFSVWFWFKYFISPSRHWFDLILPGWFLAILIVSLLRREAIEVNHEYLSRRVTVLGLPWVTRYRLADVLNPHYQPEGDDGRNRVPSFLVFEYNGKTERMFPNVEPSEVEGILREIVQRFPELATRWKIRQELYGSPDIISLNL